MRIFNFITEHFNMENNLFNNFSIDSCFDALGSVVNAGLECMGQAIDAGFDAFAGMGAGHTDFGRIDFGGIDFGGFSDFGGFGGGGFGF